MLELALALYLSIASWISLATKPNIIFILTDDQDITLGGMEGMAKTKRLIVDEGLTFTNSFVSSPICCVSRSSIMSGRYVHNHGTYNNSLDGGCSNITWKQNIEPTCLSVHIQKLGYYTIYFGKYLNKYGVKNNGGVEYIPPGWNRWYALVGNSKYYNYSISNNGKEEKHGDNYTVDYYTDLIRNQSIKHISTHNFTKRPLFMILATPASHAPFTPAPQYMNYDINKTAPRIPNYNNIAVNMYKHELFRKYITTPLDQKQLNEADEQWRNRHGTLQSVDDMIEDIYNTLKVKGVLNNTYFVYFSDNGYQDGQFGQLGDKRQLFENDIRVPFYISGPGIIPGSKKDIFALNIDIAPTLIELANGTIPEYMDGMSLESYIFGENNTKSNDIKQQFLVEYYGERGNVTTGLHGDPQHPTDSWNNTYDCIRMIKGQENEINGTIYCKFKCYDMISHFQVECPDKTLPQFYGELYNLDNDYYELNNIMLNISNTENNNYLNLLTSLVSCKGQKQCNALRQG